MRILIAPQAFKGSASAPQVASAIGTGLRRIWPDAVLTIAPIADGGEGTLDVLIQSTGGTLHEEVVTGPLGTPVRAAWGILGDGHTAVIEMAAASGLPLVPADKRNPLVTTTRGTGELIRKALDAGLRRVIVGLGGSGTNDGGAGAAQALGVHLLDARGRELPPGGAALRLLDRVDVSGVDSRVRASHILGATDVRNPLCGPEGASAIYAPQKGATPEMVERLDRALFHFGEILRRDLGANVLDMPGAGAAGGMGAGLAAFFGAELTSGVELVFDAIGLRARISQADLVITGEGRLDPQGLYGKAPLEAARLARDHGVPTIAIVGGTTDDYGVVYRHGLSGVISIVPRPMDLQEVMDRVSDLIADAAERAARLLAVGRTLRAN